jgi:DNA polymerase-3 subunit alpha
VSLFGEEQHAAGLALIAAREWTEAERLVHEKAALGFYLSGHPYGAFAAELSQIVRLKLAALSPRREPVLIAGIVTALRVQTSRRGKMAFVTLDDGGGTAEIVVWNETFDAARALLREDELVIIEAKISVRGGGEDPQAQDLRIVADAVHDLASIRRRHARALRIVCNGSAKVDRLLELLAPFRNGACPVVVDYRNRGVGGELELPEEWRVSADEALIAQLREWVTPENVSVVY